MESNIQIHRRRRNRIAAIACCALSIASAAWLPQAHAQAAVPEKGHGAVAMTYQTIAVEKHTDDLGNSMGIGNITDNALYLNLDYGLTDRLAVTAGIPYKYNRFSGFPSHDPASLPPQFRDGQRLIDDGKYRGGWADWAVSIRYQLLAEPFLLTPYIAYSRPSHDYVFFAESAFGTHQTALQFGLNAGGRFARPWQNLLWSVSGVYSFMQPKGGLRVNHANLVLDLGYLITPRLNTHLTLEHEWSFNGITDPQFINPDGSINFGYFLFHDSLLNVSYTKLSAAMGYQLNDNWSVFADYGTSLSGKEVHLIKYAVTVGISRSF